MAVEQSLVKITEWRDDESEQRFFKIESSTLKSLMDYVESGFVPDAIRVGLLHASASFPGWGTMQIDVLVPERRLALVGAYVLEVGEELKPALEIAISAD